MSSEKPYIVLLNSADSLKTIEPGVQAGFDFKNVTHLDEALALIGEKKRLISGVITSATLDEEKRWSLVDHVRRLFPDDWEVQLSFILETHWIKQYKAIAFLELLLMYRLDKNITNRLSVMANSSTASGNLAIESTVERDSSISFSRVPDHTGVQSDPVLFWEELRVMWGDPNPGGGKSQRNDLATLNAFFASFRV